MVNAGKKIVFFQMPVKMQNAMPKFNVEKISSFIKSVPGSSLDNKFVGRFKKDWRGCVHVRVCKRGCVRVKEGERLKRVQD